MNEYIWEGKKKHYFHIESVRLIEFSKKKNLFVMLMNLVHNHKFLSSIIRSAQVFILT